jgi:diguanylate cyclase (GGDEF)-like protein/PAS domain S-box-containing protein
MHTIGIMKHLLFREETLYAMNLSDSLNRLIINNTPEIIVLADRNGMIQYASPSFHTTISLDTAEAGHTALFSYIHEEDTASVTQLWTWCVQSLSMRRTEFRLRLRNETFQWVDCSMKPIAEDGELQYVLVSSRDISSRKQHEDELIHMAYYDSLTGLPNRRLFHDRYSQALHIAKRYNRKLAVLYLDLDDFKSVNDEFGHNVGDLLLKIIAARLTNCIRDPDTICRIGGDEFLIMLQQFGEPSDIEKVACRVVESLGKPVNIESHEVKVTCSIGASFYPDDCENGEALIQQADAAMYVSKKSGKNFFTPYRKDM